MNKIYYKIPKDGTYAVRILEVGRETYNNVVYIKVKFSIIVDLNNYYYEGEEMNWIVRLDKNYRIIRDFINKCNVPMINYEAAFTKNNRHSALRDLIYGLQVSNNTFIWHDLKEYRFQEFEDGPTLPF